MLDGGQLAFPAASAFCIGLEALPVVNPQNDRARGVVSAHLTNHHLKRPNPEVFNKMGDVSFCARTLSKNLGFSLVAILTLALGVGANTAIFSVVKGVLLNPLPYGDPERLVKVAESDPDTPRPVTVWRLLRQLLTESLLLALTGGLGGVLLAWWGTVALTSLGPKEFPRLE